MGAFPFLFGGTFIEGFFGGWLRRWILRFPFLFGGTFIEGAEYFMYAAVFGYFPSFSEGLSLRAGMSTACVVLSLAFPFLFGGTFIEGQWIVRACSLSGKFPFLFGGTFIEGG